MAHHSNEFGFSASGSHCLFPRFYKRPFTRWREMVGLFWRGYPMSAREVVNRVIVDGKVRQPARITVMHNGVLVQDGVEFPNRDQQGTLGLQDHKNPVRFRNIWFVPTGGGR